MVTLVHDDLPSLYVSIVEVVFIYRLKFRIGYIRNLVYNLESNILSLVIDERTIYPSATTFHPWTCQL